jgi:hypothetical protein
VWRIPAAACERIQHQVVINSILYRLFCLLVWVSIYHLQQAQISHPYLSIARSLFVAPIVRLPRWTKTPSRKRMSSSKLFKSRTGYINETLSKWGIGDYNLFAVSSHTTRRVVQLKVAYDKLEEKQSKTELECHKLNQEKVRIPSINQIRI